MDSQLNCREHVEVKVRKAHNLLWAGVWVGVGSETQGGPLAVVAIVRPTISFASLVWWPGPQTASTKKKLSKVQRLACLGITGAIRTTSPAAVEALVGLHRLDLVIQGEARSAAHRI
jgi:hypothetical protein